MSRAQCQRLAILCAKAGYARALKILCSPVFGKLGVTPDLIDSQQHCSLLGLASALGHEHAVRALSKLGATLNPENQITPLARACENGHSNIVRILIESGATVDEKSTFPPLVWTAYCNQTALIADLLAAGADPDMPDLRFNATALMYAARNNNTVMIQELIKNGANIDLTNRLGETAFRKALTCNDIGTAKVLLDHAGTQLPILQLLLDCFLLASVILQQRAKSLRRSYEHRLRVRLSHQGILGKSFSFLMMVIFPGALILLVPFLALFFILKTLSYKLLGKLTGEKDLRIMAEKTFIKACRTKTCWNEAIDALSSEHLNVNRFRVNGKNALEIALEHKDFALARKVLEQERLAPWVVLKALQKEAHTVLPLVLEHERLNDLVNCHLKALPSEQYEIYDHTLYELSRRFGSDTQRGGVGVTVRRGIKNS